VSRTARIVLAGVLTAAALVVGGVALAAGPAPAGSSSTVSVEQGGPTGLRPAQNQPDRDCPEGATGGAVNASAIRL
jgi:ABC-type transport system substrate-binding protein